MYQAQAAECLSLINAEVTKHNLSTKDYATIIQEVTKKTPKKLANLPMFKEDKYGNLQVTLREPQFTR